VTTRDETVEVEYVVIGLGALGSATAWQLARRGASVLGLEQFALGHARGASHDTSRIIRHSYHTPAYVELTFAAYDDWADLEAASGERLVTVTGGVDLFPPSAAIDIATYTSSMDACAVPYDVLTTAETAARWPQFTLPAGTSVLHQASTGIVPAARSVAAMQRLARSAGARLVEECPVTGLRDLGDHIELEAGGQSVHCRRVVVTADAWANDLLDQVGVHIPLTVLQEQVTYVQPVDPDAFAPERFPVWIWMDDPSFYGFPCYGATTVKSAEDCGGHEVDPHSRSGDVEPVAERRLLDFLARVIPGAGTTVVQSKTCLYTLTPDRDFVIGPVPGHEAVVVGLAAAHGMKFAPTFGRLLADVAVTGRSGTGLSPFDPGRPKLTAPVAATSWLV
jgi:monomeric sarcosine oxidase